MEIVNGSNHLSRMQLYLIKIGIFISLNLFLTNIFFGTDRGIPLGGYTERLVLKSLVFLCFLLALISQQKINLQRFIILFPLIYIFIFPAVFYPYLQELYTQAINPLFLLPFLFLRLSYSDIEKIFYTFLYSFIFGVLVSLTYVFYSYYENITSIITMGFTYFGAGLGNANSLGFVAISIMLLSRLFCSPNNHNLIIVFTLICCILTGSLANILFFSIALTYLIMTKLSYRLSLVSIITFLVFVVLLGSSFYALFFSELLPANHVLRKIGGLLIYLSSGEFTGSASVDLRREYFDLGMEVWTSSIMSILLGHGRDLIYFTGDGGLLGYLVTHGLIVFLPFSALFLVLISSNFLSGDPLKRMCAVVLTLTFMYLFVNRILDYWGTASILVFVLAIIFSLNEQIKNNTRLES